MDERGHSFCISLGCGSVIIVLEFIYELRRPLLEMICLLRQEELFLF